MAATTPEARLATALKRVIGQLQALVDGDIEGEDPADVAIQLKASAGGTAKALHDYISEHIELQLDEGLSSQPAVPRPLSQKLRQLSKLLMSAPPAPRSNEEPIEERISPAPRKAAPGRTTRKAPPAAPARG